MEEKKKIFNFFFSYLVYSLILHRYQYALHPFFSLLGPTVNGQVSRLSYISPYIICFWLIVIVIFHDIIFGNLLNCFIFSCMLTHRDLYSGIPI